MAEIEAKTRVQTQQRAQWITDTVLVAQAVLSGNKLLGPIFWIRLYGVVHEIYDNLASIRDRARNLNAPTTAIDTTLAEISALGSRFTADEQLYLQYRRDTECHPVQHNYEFQISPRGGTKERFYLKLLGERRDISTMELKAAVTRVIGHPPNEASLALAFAERCIDVLERVERAAAKVY